MAPGDLSNRERAIIGLLPPERGRNARPAHDNRRVLDGMRVGRRSRDMHERHGRWNSVIVRFRRWAGQGVWDALLETPVGLGLTDGWRHMIDGTAVRGHSQAVGAKEGLARGAPVEAAAALRARSTPVRTVGSTFSASS